MNSGASGQEAGGAALLPLVQMLARHRRLGDEDRAAVLGLPYSLRELARDTILVSEGDSVTHSAILSSGYMYRQKIATAQGKRQILEVHLPGDLVDLQNGFFERADHDVLALTRCTVAMVPVEALLQVCFARPQIGLAVWTASLLDAAIQRELTASIGQRDARGRIAHFLCEFGVRTELAGLGRRTEYVLPMTQDHLADLLGITSIHINRSIRQLDSEGLLVRAQREVRIMDFSALATIGDFRPDYLHIRAGALSGRESVTA